MSGLLSALSVCQSGTTHRLSRASGEGASPPPRPTFGIVVVASVAGAEIERAVLVPLEGDISPRETGTTSPDTRVTLLTAGVER